MATKRERRYIQVRRIKKKHTHKLRGSIQLWSASVQLMKVDSSHSYGALGPAMLEWSFTNTIPRCVTIELGLSPSTTPCTLDPSQCELATSGWRLMGRLTIEPNRTVSIDSNLKGNHHTNCSVGTDLYRTVSNDGNLKENHHTTGVRNQ